ncbi:MAG TPA: PKD domain-containing protein, partial [Candidatus Hydrogenedentes bacterium]|nr:PKD domain-containing protein [Candidatus Hydrogenedentota bacterium]
MDTKRNTMMSKLLSFGITLCLIITVGALGGCPGADTETKARHIRPARATDNMAPTVTMTSAVSDVTDLSPIRVTVKFSELVRGFRQSDLDVTNAAVTGFTGDGANYGFYLVPAAEGVVTADIPAAVAKDGANNWNAAAEQFRRTCDANAPSAMMSTPTVDPTNASPIPVTVTFTEPVTGFDATDVVPGNATVTNFAGSGANYSFDLIPAADGLVAVDVPAGVAQDVAANDNKAAQQLTRMYTGTAPATALSSTVEDPTATSPIPVVVTFSRPVAGFDAGDVATTNATVADFAGFGTDYTFDLVPVADGLVIAEVAEGVAQDAVGNGNAAAPQFSRMYNAAAPTVVLSSTAANPTSTSPIPVTVEFSEPVTGFDATDIVVTNGTVTGLAGSDAAYTFDLTPAGEGLVTADIAADAAQGATGTGNAAATQFARNYVLAIDVPLEAVVEVNEAQWIVDRRAAGPLYGYGDAYVTQNYAPLPVFFEGWQSTPRAEIVEFEWDFGDGTEPFNGFNAAHVYETPGTYVATLTVTNVYGATATDTITIEVLERDGITYYVDAEFGDDANDGMSPGAGAWRTAQHAFNGIGEKRYAPGDEVLFTRGQVFPIESKAVAFTHWPGYGFAFGAYGDPADPKPLIQLTGMATSDNPSVEHPMIFANTAVGLAHVAFVDLAFNATSDIDANNMATIYYSSGATQNLLFYRCDFEDFLNGFMTQSPDPGVVFGIFIIECTFYRSATTHLFAEATHYAVVDTSLDLSGNHIAYLGVLDTAVITGNHFSRPAFGRTAMRMCFFFNDTAPTENIVITDNIFEGWIDPVVNDYDA